MPPGSQRYTLRNFSDELDWRPLHFVDSLPPARVCSACGLLVKLTGTLPCGHFLCGPCYQQQRELGGALCCPFDGEACLEESVHWREFPAENLLERQVNCWNEASGCTVVIAASQLSRHFYHECEHHSISCPKCSTKILCNNLCSHLRSCTGSRGLGVTESAWEASDNRQATELTALKTTLSTATRQMEQQLGDLKGWLERLSLEGNLQTDQINALSHTMNNLKEMQTDHINALSHTMNNLKEMQSDQINELSHTMNNLKETLTQDLETVVSQNRDGIAHHGADIVTVKDTVVETGRETFKKIDSVLCHTLKTQCTHDWILKGYHSLKAKAMRLGSADRYSNPVYLCHYMVLPGVHLKRDSQSVSLHLQLCLKKGEVDEYLQWPFQKRMVLSVVHPVTHETKKIECRPNIQLDCYSRPTTPCSQALYSAACFHLSDLERDGYIKSDQLVLCSALM